MKVFIRANDIAEEKPVVIATYADDSIVPNDANGEGMTVLSLPAAALEKPPGEPQRLVKDWRQRAGTTTVTNEAKRRIEEAFPLHDQLAALHEELEAVIAHWSDLSKWPADVRQRKQACDERWKYVSAVRDKAREHAGVMPRDPASDKAWPQRPRKV